MKRDTVWVLIVTAGLACSGAPERTSVDSAPLPPAPPKVTTATFDSVYRAAKAIQGATEVGVTYVKFGELLQNLSTELSIASDRPLNEADKQLLDVYEEALTDYQVSAQLWGMKNRMDEDTWKGEIPIAFKGAQLAPDFAKMVATYDLPVTDRKLAVLGTRYKAIPGDSAQRVWRKADATLDLATEFYYGRKTLDEIARERSLQDERRRKAQESVDRIRLR